MSGVAPPVSSQTQAQLIEKTVLSFKLLPNIEQAESNLKMDPRFAFVTESHSDYPFYLWTKQRILSAPILPHSAPILPSGIIPGIPIPPAIVISDASSQSTAPIKATFEPSRLEQLLSGLNGTQQGISDTSAWILECVQNSDQDTSEDQSTMMIECITDMIRSVIRDTPIASQPSPIHVLFLLHDLLYKSLNLCVNVENTQILISKKKDKDGDTPMEDGIRTDDESESMRIRRNHNKSTAISRLARSLSDECLRLCVKKCAQRGEGSRARELVVMWKEKELFGKRTSVVCKKLNLVIRQNEGRTSFVGSVGAMIDLSLQVKREGAGVAYAPVPIQRLRQHTERLEEMGEDSAMDASVASVASVDLFVQFNEFRDKMQRMNQVGQT